MLSKINFVKIVTRHFGTLKDAGSNNVSIADIVIFYVFPALTSFALVVYPFDVEFGSTESLLTVASVLFGFMTTVYLFVVERMAADAARGTHADTLLKHTQANVGYASFLLLLLMCLLFAASAFDRGHGEAGMPVALDALILFLCMHFALTMLMVIKRVDGLATSESQG